MINILIADDHAIVRQGLKQIIADQTDMRVGGEADNGLAALELLRKQHWDIAVIDISMPGRGGLDILKEMKSERPKLPVLVLSMHPEDQYALRALRAGAAGYITKESAPEELVTAIRKILSGRKYVSQSLAEKLADEVADNGGKPLHEQLSDRELQVLCLIASGKTVSDIGTELSLSVKTISTYRTRILEKMNMKTNADLMHYAISAKLVP
jgi:DNA-binding NarL/FixJ family response regulator